MRKTIGAGVMVAAVVAIPAATVITRGSGGKPTRGARQRPAGPTIGAARPKIYGRLVYLLSTPDGRQVRGRQTGLNVRLGPALRRAGGYAYRWSACDQAGGHCSPIRAATSSHYQLTATDVGDRLTVTVMARSPHGRIAATSAPTAVIKTTAYRTFYIDSARGSDANRGTSETAPWQRAPGMASFAGRYRHRFGDHFIFEGGDRWGNAAFPLAVVGSGTAGDDDYYGANPTWYVGRAFVQPVFDAGGALTPGPDSNGPQPYTSAGANDVMFDADGHDYIQLDDIHFTGFRRDTKMNVGGVCAVVNINNQGNAAYDQNVTINHVTIDNMYQDAGSAATATCDAVSGGNNVSGNYSGSSVVENSTIAGDGATYMAGIGNVGNIENDSVHDLGGGLLYPASTSTGTISGNQLYDCMYPTLPSDGGQTNNKHADIIQIGANANQPATTFYIHDNVIYGNGESGYSTGSGAGDECESVLIGNYNETDYLWNNVIYDVYGNGPAIGGSGASGAAPTNEYIWNNSVEPGTDAQGGQACFRAGSDGGQPLNLTIQNNLCVTTSRAVAYVGPFVTVRHDVISHNVTITPVQAAAQGFVVSSRRREPMWRPPATRSPRTHGAGVNLTSDCKGRLSGLCLTSSYGGDLGVTARSETGVWDVGAY